MHRMFAAAAWLVLLAASGSVAGAQYTAIDLYAMQVPSGLQGTYPPISAVAGQVVGSAQPPTPPDGNPPPPHPVLWNQDGSAVDLNLPGFDKAAVSGTDGIHQFGSASSGTYSPSFTPVVWSDSAASAIILSVQGIDAGGVRVDASVEGGGGGQFVGWGGTQFTARATLWNGLNAPPIDLHPTNLLGISRSVAYGTNGAQQVGCATVFDANHNGYSHALLWTGNASSAVDLNPTHLPGITNSQAVATDGAQQVGNGGSHFLALDHALLWSGSADSAAILTPPGFDSSHAYGVRNGKQAGVAGTHAMLWSGTADSAVDLHLLLPDSFAHSRAYSIDDDGHVFGVAFNSDDQLYHAIKWLPLDESSPDNNNDGNVDGADFLLLQRTENSSAGYSAWRSHFGQTATVGAVLDAVPEPTLIVALLPLAPAALLRRRTPRQVQKQRHTTLGKSPQYYERFPMKLASIGLVAGSMATLLASPALAITQTKARATANEGVYDRAFRSSMGMGFGGFLLFPASDEDFGAAGESIEVLAAPDGSPNTEGDVQAFAEGFANARIGKLGVSVVGAVRGAARNRIPFFSDGGRASATALAGAEWLDTVTLRSRSRKFLRVVYNVFMDGALDVAATGNAASDVSFNLANANGSSLIVPDGPLGGVGWGEASKHPELGVTSEDIPGGFRVELQATSGEPVTIGLSIGLRGNAVSDISINESVWTDDVASFSGEVSRSIKWGGVESVFDAQTGEQLDLDDVTMTSESGFDYTKPFSVPEPSSLMLLGTTLCALFAARWRRR